MKKFPILLLAVLALPAHSESQLEKLKKSKAAARTSPSSSTSGGVEVTATTGVTPSVTDTTCEVEEKTSLSQEYVDSLIQDGGKVEYFHNPLSGVLEIKAPKMISNCSNMYEWVVKSGTVANEKAYVVEVKIVPPTEHTLPDGTKKKGYKILTVDDGKPKYKVAEFEANYSGVEACLKEAKVFKEDGSIDKDRVYDQPVMKKFTGINESAKLLFSSNGMRRKEDAPLFGTNYVAQNKCDFFENVESESGKRLLSAADVDSAAKQELLSKLNSCTSDKYQEVLDSFDSAANAELRPLIQQILVKLLKEAAEKSAANIAKGEGKPSKEDLKVIEDFDKYVIAPQIEYMRKLYLDYDLASGTAKENLGIEIKKQADVLKGLNSKPYYTGTHTQKLLEAGMFESALLVNAMNQNINIHKTLGQKQNGVVITPAVAMVKLGQERKTFEAQVVDYKEKWEIRHGESTGKSQLYNKMAQQMRQNAIVRTQNKTEQLKELYADIDQSNPRAYCFQWYRAHVAQKCVQEKLNEINFVTNALGQNNKVDMDRAAEFNAKAKEYNDLENEGRRYLASQNGEAAPADVAAPAAVDTTNPTPSASDMATQNAATQQDRMYQQMMSSAQNQQNPMLQNGAPVFPQNYQQYGYQQQYGQNYNQYTQNGYNPFMGQQAYGGAQYGYQQPGMNYFGAGFNGQVGAGAGAPQGYWGQPNTAYQYPNFYRN